MSRETEGHMPDDDMLAAEYVLGVQSVELRESLAKRLLSDAAFAALVSRWEEHLAPMNDAFEPVTPPLHLKTKIFARLFPDASFQSPGLWNNLRLWRGLTLGALALSAFIIGTTVLRPLPDTTTDVLVASLQADTGDVRFMAYYEPESGEIRLSKITADKPSDRDFELWLIEADGTPQSIGVITDTAQARIAVTADFAAKINSGDTFAISVEPIGGSPTGKVTGPVIAAGVSAAL